MAKLSSIYTKQKVLQHFENKGFDAIVKDYLRKTGKTQNFGFVTMKFFNL